MQPIKFIRIGALNKGLFSTIRCDGAKLQLSQPYPP